MTTQILTDIAWISVYALAFSAGSLAHVRKLAKYGVDEKQIRTGSIAYASVVMAPMTYLGIRNIVLADLAIAGDIARLALYALSCVGIICLVEILQRTGVLVQLPFIGKSLNAYFLAHERRKLEECKERVRRYEEFGLSAMEAA